MEGALLKENFMHYLLDLVLPGMFIIAGALLISTAVNIPSTPGHRCIQEELDKHSEEIGAYEITCEELEEL